MRLADLLRAKNKGADDIAQAAVGTGDSPWRDEVRSLPLDQIRTNPFQPRREFRPEQIEELAASVEEHGILHPVVVRPVENGYELVVGERRLRACRQLGWDAIPAIVRELSDAETAEIALIENLQRENLSFFEEAEGYQRLLEEFGLTQDELAGRLGKSQSSIANKIRLLRLGDDVREIISREMLSERHARALLKLSDEKDQLAAARAIVEKGLNVAQTEAWIENALSEQAQGGVKKRRRAQSVKGVYKDYRLLANSVQQLVQQMKADGADVDYEERPGDDFVELCIRVRLTEKGGR